MAAAPDAVSATDAAPPSELGTLLKAGAASADIARHLDALDPVEKLRQVLAVTGKWVHALHAAVADVPPLSLDEFVPPSTTGTTLIYEGRNSLAMFSRFQKRFFRTKSGVIVGYNHQTMKWATGPGYFVVQPADGKEPVPNELYIDYITEPPEIPEGWPPFKPNSRGLSRAVYYNTHDYMRRVATGVYVGKAYRLTEDINACFTLTLPPPGAQA